MFFTARLIRQLLCFTKISLPDTILRELMLSLSARSTIKDYVLTKIMCTNEAFVKSYIFIFHFLRIFSHVNWIRRKVILFHVFLYFSKIFTFTKRFWLYFSVFIQYSINPFDAESILAKWAGSFSFIENIKHYF